MPPSKIKFMFMSINAMFTAPIASMELNMRGLCPYDASWQTNPTLGKRTLLIWSINHCSKDGYRKEYLEGRAKGGTH